MDITKAYSKVWEPEASRLLMATVSFHAGRREFPFSIPVRVNMQAEKYASAACIAVSNYRPFPCLVINFMWPTAMLRGNY